MTRRAKREWLALDGNQARLELTDEDLSRVVALALREVELASLIAQGSELGLQKNSISDRTLLQQFTQSFLKVARVHG